MDFSSTSHVGGDGSNGIYSAFDQSNSIGTNCLPEAFFEFVIGCSNVLISVDSATFFLPNNLKNKSNIYHLISLRQ